MNTQEYAVQLVAAAKQVGLKLDDRQQQAILSYIAQIQRWNKTYNLTALREPWQIFVQHVLDSLAIVSPILQRLQKHQQPADNLKIVDVGSGAGLPGVMLAIMRPDWQIYCVDAVEKKMAFVRQMCGALDLPNLHAVHGRIEKLPVLDADIVVSRAFASLLDFATLAGRHVAPEGELLAMKGRHPTDEINDLHAGQTDWRVQGIETLSVPHLDAQRCLVWMVRQGNL